MTYNFNVRLRADAQEDTQRNEQYRPRARVEPNDDKIMETIPATVGGFGSSGRRRRKPRAIVWRGRRVPRATATFARTAFKHPELTTTAVMDKDRFSTCPEITLTDAATVAATTTPYVAAGYTLTNHPRRRRTSGQKPLIHHP